MEYIYLILIGLIGGILAGLLGVGGGIVYILVLPIVFAEQGLCEQEVVSVVVANSILASLMASLSANTKRILDGAFDYKTIFQIGMGGVISSISVMKFIVQTEFYSRTVFNFVVITLLLFMAYRMLRDRSEAGKFKGLKSWQMWLIGIAAGTVAALSGLGGGVIIVPALTILFSLNIKQAKDISLGVIGFMAIFFSVRNGLQPFECKSLYGQVGLLVLPVTLTMGIGVIIGAPVGIKIGKIMPGRIIKIIFALMLGAVIFKKGVEIYNAFS